VVVNAVLLVGGVVKAVDISDVVKGVGDSLIVGVVVIVSAFGVAALVFIISRSHNKRQFAGYQPRSRISF